MSCSRTCHAAGGRGDRAGVTVQGAGGGGDSAGGGGDAFSEALLQPWPPSSSCGTTMLSLRPLQGE